MTTYKWVGYERPVIRKPEGRDPSTLYLTVRQVAAMRGCHEQVVRQQIYSHRLPAWTIGGIYLIPRQDAEDWALRKSAITGKGKEITATERRLKRLQKAQAQRAIAEGRVIERAKAGRDD